MLTPVVMMQANCTTDTYANMHCMRRAKARDVTALFNLPKKVAAGSAGSAVELEQQLQEAQQQAEREHQRARQLEQQLQVGSPVET
jgi:hypothetical protein